MKTKPVRETVIRIKIQEIRECVSLVEDALPGSAEEFRNLGLIKDGIYKRIEFAIEDVFDICAILNADLMLGVPGEDEDILMNCLNNGILTDEMSEKIYGMRGFRNIVVHRYGKIEDTLAFNLLSENLGHFFQFVALIETVLLTLLTRR